MGGKSGILDGKGDRRCDANDGTAFLMAVLTTRDFESRLKLPVSDPCSLVITPLPPPGAYTEDSVDLRLGTHFLLPQVPPQPYIDPGAAEGFRNYLQLHAPLGSYFVLPAHQTVLGATLEYIKLPCDLSGEILTKSSVARTFMIIETAPWVHPNYRGCLTLEIANASNTAILLYPGMPIGQLILMGTTKESCNEQKNEVTQMLSGSYIGPVYPEPPRLKHPQEMLEKIGITNYRRPGFGWVNNSRMQTELEQISKQLDPNQAAVVKAVIKVILENGGLHADNPASSVFK
jgi:dCTP deaminase